MEQGTNKNKFAKFIKGGIFVFSALVGVAVVYFFYVKFDNILTDYFVRTLQMIGEARAEQVKLFLEGKQNRVVDFSSDGFIKNSLYNIKHGNNAEEAVAQLNRHLIVNKAPVDKRFYNVFALGMNGVVVSSTNKDAIGEDLSGSQIFLEGRSRSYVKSLSYDVVAKVNSLVLAAPVIRENELVGVIAIKMLPDDLVTIMLKNNYFSEKLDTYIINKDGYLMTPSKFLEGENKGVLTQVVDSENAKKCLKDIKKVLDTGEVHTFDEEEPVFFVGYRGEHAVGSHHIVPEINWCLLSEIDTSEMWKDKKEGIQAAILFLLVGFGLSTLIIYFVVRKKTD